MSDKVFNSFLYNPDFSLEMFSNRRTSTSPMQSNAQLSRFRYPPFAFTRSYPLKPFQKQEDFPRSENQNYTPRNTLLGGRKGFLWKLTSAYQNSLFFLTSSHKSACEEKTGLKFSAHVVGVNIFACFHSVKENCENE